MAALSVRQKVMAKKKCNFYNLIYEFLTKKREGGGIKKTAKVKKQVKV